MWGFAQICTFVCKCMIEFDGGICMGYRTLEISTACEIHIKEGQLMKEICFNEKV